LLPSGISALQLGQTMPHLCPLEQVSEALIDVVTMAERGCAPSTFQSCPLVRANTHPTTVMIAALQLQ
jgi:hypothetical protein